MGGQRRSPGFWPGSLTRNRRQNCPRILLTEAQAGSWGCWPSGCGRGDPDISVLEISQVNLCQPSLGCLAWTTRRLPRGFINYPDLNPGLKEFCSVT